MYKRFTAFSTFAFKQFERIGQFQRNQWFSKKTKFEYKSLYFIPFLLTPKILFCEEEKKEKKLDMKVIIRGEYENRIRAFSSIEKKYTIFAAVKNFEHVRMNYFQFFDSLIPFAYSDIISNQEVIIKILNINTCLSHSYKRNY